MNSVVDVVLHLDYRERGLFDKLKSKIEDERLKLLPLEVGDILFKVNDTAVLIFERKTESDLLSSIIDGRFRNQKERLTMSGLPVCYLIEDERKKRSTCDKKERMYRGSLVNLIFCHKFNVLHTKSIVDTADYLFDIYNKIKTGKIQLWNNNCNGVSDTQLVSKSKSRADIPPIVSQLSLIRGVSVNMAKTIAAIYSTPKELVQSLNESGENLLATIEYGSKRIGKAISKRIYDTYVGTISHLETKHCL